jgi:hypothetical protein
MKLVIAAAVIGPLMLFGALPAAADPSSLDLRAGTAVRLAATGDPAIDHDSYTQKARDDMQDWQRKLREVGDRAEAKGKAAGTAADDGLNQAWTKAKTASDRLQTIGSEGWDSAKTSFEQASHDLAESWHKVHPNDK